MTASTYRILDEPEPSSMAWLVVNPFWILLSLMLGGAWLAFPWFVLNSVALGSAGRVKEVAISAAGFLGAMALAALGLGLYGAGVLDRQDLPYAGTVLLLWKLGAAYFVHASQAVSHELYTHFGGKSRNALLVVILSVFGRGAVLSLIDGDFWVLVLM